MELLPNERLLLHHFEQFISESRKAIINKVLSQRTRHVTVVLEDIFQSQNSSAVVRTCECMGLQDIHIVENTTQYFVNTRVLKGANKWMNLIRYRDKGINNTAICFSQLRERGYKIYTADPAEEGISIHDITTEEPCAIVFGNELNGATDFALENCDQRVRIPMFGFTESLNISVSVAICLNALITKLRSTQGAYGLSTNECEWLTLQWYRKSVRRSHLIEREFMRTIE
jgi:tRNA (guanosine-2'-O-)-methyltransferase